MVTQTTKGREKEESSHDEESVGSEEIVCPDSVGATPETAGKLGDFIRAEIQRHRSATGFSNPSAALRQAAAAGLKSRLCRWSMVDARTMTQKVPSRHLAREREADFVPHAVMPDEGHTRGRVLSSSCHDARAGCDANALQWGRRGENPHQKIAKNAHLSYPIMCIWPL